MSVDNQSVGAPAATPPFKPQLRLQTLTPDLLPAVVDLDRRCFGQLWTLAGYRRELDSPNSKLLVLCPDPPPPSTPPPVEGRRDESTSLLGADPPNAPHLTASILGIGCYWAILEEAHITIVAIDPAYHHQGLGQLVLCQLLRSAHQRGLERATLEVRASHQAAIALYTKFSFQEAGRRKDYYPDTREDALILWLGGLHHPNFPQRLADWEHQVGDRLHQKGWPPPFVAIS